MAKIAIVTCLALVTLWGLGLYGFYSQIPASRDAKTPKADAIIVLTGGSERIPEGLNLLKNGYSGRLFISGVGKDTTIDQLLEKQKLSTKDLSKLPKNKIHLGRQAINTIGNAKETADWIQANNVKSILLVTANYHMPRAVVEFEQRLPYDVQVIPHPVFPQNFKRDQWRNDELTRNFILIEYTKYIMAMLGK